MSKKIISEIKELASKMANSNNLNISELKQEISVLYDKLTVLEFLEDSIYIVENKDSSTKTVETEPTKVEVIDEITEEPETVIEALDFLKVDEVAESDRAITTSDEVVNDEEQIEQVIKENIEVVVEEKAIVNDLTVVTSIDTTKVEEQVKHGIIEDEKAEQGEEDLDNKDETSPLNTKIEEVKVANTSKSLHETFDTKKSSLHEELKKNHIQIGLNDRIAFVKRLFDGSQQDFHRVLSQVNTFATIEEVREFIDTMVRPEHNWENQEEYAERFMEIIEVKFQ